MHGICHIQELTEEQLLEVIDTYRGSSKAIRDLMDYDLHVRELESRRDPKIALSRADLRRALMDSDLTSEEVSFYQIEEVTFFKNLGI